MPNCHTNCFCTIEYPTSTQCIVLNYIYQWFPNPLDHDIPSGSPAPDSICDVRKLFLFWLPIQKDWKAKLESAYSFMLKHSKITVCAYTALSQPSHIVTSLRSRPSVSIYWSGMSKIVQYFIYHSISQDTSVSSVCVNTKKLQAGKSQRSLTFL